MDSIPINNYFIIFIFILIFVILINFIILKIRFYYSNGKDTIFRFESDYMVPIKDENEEV